MQVLRGGRSSRKDGRHARGRERRHRVFALVTQGCFGLLAGCTMHALKASDTTTPAAFAEHCIASGFLAFAMRTLRSFAALPSAADTNPLAGMVGAADDRAPGGRGGSSPRPAPR